MSGSNNILQFDPYLLNIQNDSDYSSSTYRQNGVGTGIALVSTHNKLFYQLSTVCTALAQMAADRGQNVSDANLANLIAAFKATIQDPNALYLPDYIPYSVNSGLTSINKVSNSAVNFTGTPTVTFPSGKTYVGLTLNNITGISADGTYDFIIEEASILNNAITPLAVPVANTAESLTNGSGGSDGNYNLNISVRPLYPEKRISGTWNQTQFLKLGGAVRTGGTLGTPYVYSFNRKFIQLGVTPPSASGAKAVAHYMGINPQFVSAKVWAQCTSAVDGYSIGDIIQNWVEKVAYTGDITRADIWADATTRPIVDRNNITYLRGYATDYQSKTSGSNGGLAMDWTKWNLIYIAEGVF